MIHDIMMHDTSDYSGQFAVPGFKKLTQDKE